MRVEPQQLKAFMIDANLIEESKFDLLLDKAKKEGKRIEEVLLEEKILSEEQLAKLKAYILGIPYVSLEKETIDLDVLKIIPETIARSYNIIAYKKKGNQLEVAMVDPGDLLIIDFLSKTTNFKILPRLTTKEGIKFALQKYQKTLESELGEIISQKEVFLLPEKQSEEESVDLKKAAHELPIIRIVDTIIKHAILKKASDIHIEPTEKEVLVRYRIDGILKDAMILPKISAAGIVARIKVLSNLKLDEHRLPQDGRFKIEIPDYKFSVRVSVLPVFDGEKIVMRLLPETEKPFTLEELGLRGKALEDTKLALGKATGMILVTGPTGSGKTTTLYSMLSLLNTPEVNISTLEDPVEYRIPRINQTQVNPKIGLTFASGLRSLVRQDPDIIMVGEIRDKETASLAINAALTGHLVLSTLHTNSAAGSIPRLIDMKVEPFLISSTLILIVAQRLVRKLTPEKEKYFLSKEEINTLSKYCNLEKILRVLKKENLISQKATINKIPFWRPRPSKEYPDGYHGRIGIFEVLPITQRIKSLILKQASADEIEKVAKEDGMVSMIEDGFIKAVQGITSLEEVLRVVTE